MAKGDDDVSGEADYLIVPGGAVYPLHVWGQELLSVSGLGEIGLEYQTTRGYGQHGQTVLGWRLTPRSISFQMSHAARSRRDFWAAREALLVAIRPYIGQAVTYRKVFPNGARRDIQGWLREGPSIEETDHHSFASSFVLECPDPSFYDPAVQTITLAAGFPRAVALPVTLYTVQACPDDGFWCERAATVRGDAQYAGTWRSYPVIQIDGPYQWFRLENTRTGAYLTLSVSLDVGRTLTIDLTPGTQSITDDLGNDRLNDRSAGSFIDFYLEAGSNEIVGDGGGVSSSTQVRVQYVNRYIGL